MTVYVTRHAQPASVSGSNKEENQFSSLSELGRNQAKNLGDRLAEMDFSGRVYASPFHRCLETADWLCQRNTTVFYPEPAIAEIAGDWIADFTGLSIDEIRERYSCCADTAELAWPWWSDTSETQKAVEERVGNFLDQRLADEAQDILLVGHGATSGAVATSLCGRGIESECTDSAGVKLHYNAALTAIDTDGTPTFRYQNDTSHLGSGESTNNNQVVK